MTPYKAALSLVAASLLTACADNTATPEPILIGASMSLSGAYATQGRPAANGYRLCERDVNDTGGVLGRPIQFLIEDDESDTEKVQAIYQRLITEQGVDAVMGPYGSTLTEALAPVTEQHQMVQISPLAATTSIWEQGREYLFMVLPPAELFLTGLIDMADARGLTRVAVVYENALFPGAAAQGAVAEAERRGMELVLQHAYAPGDGDFAELARQLEMAQTEVLAMAASTLSDFARMAEALRAAEVQVNMFGTSGAVQEFYDQLGDTAEYTFALSAWEPAAPNPGAEAFTAAYQAAFQQAPSFHAAGAYGSCQLLVEAIKGAGSLNQSDIRDVLRNLQTDTVFGPFAVDSRGYQTANQGLFIQWQDGEKVVVWPPEVATHEVRYPVPDWSQRD